VRIRAVESNDDVLLYVKDQNVGYLRDDLVGFLGFATADEAAEAACIAHRALARRRSGTPGSPADEYLFGHTDEGQFVIARSGVLARLLPPDPVSGEMGWGFELALRANEAPRIFALARARLIWAALRTSGLASPTAKENCPVSKALSGVEILLKSSKLTEVPVERA
jgi:hypothetical protein